MVKRTGNISKEDAEKVRQALKSGSCSLQGSLTLHSPGGESAAIGSFTINLDPKSSSDPAQVSFGGELCGTFLVERLLELDLARSLSVSGSLLSLELQSSLKNSGSIASGRSEDGTSKIRSTYLLGFCRRFFGQLLLR